MYDSRADAGLDGTLEKPLRAARSPHPSSIAFRYIKRQANGFIKIPK